MKLTGQHMKVAAAAIAAVLVAGCGGGGGGSGGEPAAPTVSSEELARETALTVAAVAFYDSFAGLDRMLHLLSYDKVIGPVGGGAVPCPGGGTLGWDKDPAEFRLWANDCRPLPTDGLVYKGKWRLTVEFDGYVAGLCPAQPCRLAGKILPAEALYGYGTATVPVSGTTYSVELEGGSRKVFMSTNGVVDFGQGVSVMLQGNLNRDYAGPFGASVFINPDSGGFTAWSDDDRATINFILTREPLIRGRASIGTEVRVAIDRGADGTNDAVLEVPWSTFLD
jgi:hypothetical protein